MALIFIGWAVDVIAAVFAVVAVVVVVVVAVFVVVVVVVVVAVAVAVAVVAAVAAAVAAVALFTFGSKYKKTDTFTEWSMLTFSLSLVLRPAYSKTKGTLHHFVLSCLCPC